MTSSNPAPPFYSSFEEEYHLLKNQAALFRDGKGILHLRGGETVDFLQRLSTNDVVTLAEGGIVTSVLTTEKGRVVDVCTFIPDEGGFLAVTSAGLAGTVKAWLEKYIIMEDITVEDLSSSFTTNCLINPQADSFFSSILGTSAPIVPRKPLRFDFTGHPFILFHDDAFGAPVYRLVASPEAFEVLRGKGVHREGLRMVGNMAFESFRIEQGVPLAGPDVNDQANPLEAGLKRYVSFTKGCYIGQEVIARIDTYKKLQKELRGLIIETSERHALPPGEIWAGSEKIGYTTSHAWSFTLDRQVALGFVKTSVPTHGVEYRDPSRSASIPARLAEFPLC